MFLAMPAPINPTPINPIKGLLIVFPCFVYFVNFLAATTAL
jgi:hypothetical protein